MAKAVSRSSAVGLMVGVMALGLMGCGQRIGGAWSVTMTAIQSQVYQCQTSQMALNVIESGSNLSGQSSNHCFTATLAGTDSGNGIITNASLTLTPVGYQQACPAYTGTLIVANRTISGTLNMTMPQQQPQAPVQIPPGCPLAITLSGSVYN